MNMVTIQLRPGTLLDNPHGLTEVTITSEEVTQFLLDLIADFRVTDHIILSLPVDELQHQLDITTALYDETEHSFTNKMFPVLAEASRQLRERLEVLTGSLPASLDEMVAL